MARKLGDFRLLRLTASASTIDVASERIGTSANSGGKPRAEPQREKTKLSIVAQVGRAFWFQLPDERHGARRTLLREGQVPGSGFIFRFADPDLNCSL